MSRDLQVGLAPFFKWMSEKLLMLIEQWDRVMGSFRRGGRAVRKLMQGNFSGAIEDVKSAVDIRLNGRVPDVKTPVVEPPEAKRRRLRDEYANSVNGRGSGTANEQRLFDEIKALTAQIRESNKTAVQY